MRSLWRLLAAILLTAAIILPAAAESDWPTYGGQSSGTKYSALDQINLATIDKLDVAWTYHTGEVSPNTDDMDQTVYEVTPIFDNDRLYLCTPLNRIVALDPETGRQVWRFDPEKPRTGNLYHENYCRGVAYWQAATAEERGQFCGKRVFEAVESGVLVAVDADTGRLCPDFGSAGRIDLNTLDYKGDGRVANSSPPIIYRDVLILGGAMLDNKTMDMPDGIVRGFDVRTGTEIWNWDPIPDALSRKTGAANAWAPLSVDEEHGWVFLPTTSPSLDTYGVNRLDPIPNADAVVALDALTGHLVWSYQIVHHDLFDYDLPATPVLATLQRDGTSVPAVIQATKMGFVFVLDRLTGNPLFPVEEKPAPPSDIPGEIASPTQRVPSLPLPVTPQHMTADDAWGAVYFDRSACRAKLAPLRNEGLFTPPSEQGSILFPSFLGGSNWGGVAYDADSGLAVLNSSNIVSAVRLVRRENFDAARDMHPGLAYYEMGGSPYVMLREMLLSPLGAPCNPPPWGQLTAIDVSTGATRWQIPFGRMRFWGGFRSPVAWGAPNQGGPIITKGGLVFIGASLDSRFRAYDLKTGKEVWYHDVPAPATATPMTYQAGPKHRQFVVVAAGGHGAFNTPLSDAIVAFALPE